MADQEGGSGSGVVDEFSVVISLEAMNRKL